MLAFLPEQAYNHFHREQAFNPKARSGYLGIGRRNVDPVYRENDRRLKECGD